ncbi:hypothetical protein X798_07544, partial [Onchocerca flexuosa]
SKHLQTFDIWNSQVNTVITVLCYISSCANPITYCFLNKKFRTALLITFGCLRKDTNQYQTTYLPEQVDTLTPGKSTDEMSVLRIERKDQNTQSAINTIHSKTILYHTGSTTTTTVKMNTQYPQRKRPEFHYC